TYTLVGPNPDPSCTGPVVGTSTVVVGSPSVPFTVVATGTYNFVATYSGDANYFPVTTPVGCGDPNERFAVAPQPVTLVTQASTNGATVVPGTAVTDFAVLTPPAGGPAPTGTITYTLVGPNPSVTCTSPVFGVSTVPVGSPSAPFTPVVPGVYNFVATYSGDANYQPITTPVGCNVPAERFVVARRPVNLVTQASTNSTAAPPGTVVTDYAAFITPPGAPNPTGTVTYTLVGPDPGPACTGPIVGTSTVPLGSGSGSFTVVVPGTYNFLATYSGDPNYEPVITPVGCGDPAERFTVAGGGVAGARYTPLDPVRTLDTRIGAGGTGPLGPGAILDVPVTGRGGVPPSGVTAVALNVTVTEPTADGWLTLYPSGTPPPHVSNLNFTPGKTVPNLVVVKVGTGGNVAVFNSAGRTDVIFDVAGYFSDPVPASEGRFQPVFPARLLDTRTGIGGGARLGPGQSLDLVVAGRSGVPASGARAVVLNVAATATTDQSFLTVYPTGTGLPLASNVNFMAGDTVSNRVMVRLGSGGRVTIFNQAGGVDVVVDLNGWYTDSSVVSVAGTYTALQPTRIVDTRIDLPGVPTTGPVPAGATVEVQVGGRGGVPAFGVTAVILNVTVTQPAGPGFLTIYPSNIPPPLASDLNYAAGETRPNLVVVQVDSAGRIDVDTSAQTHLIVDVAGYFA
ncbi:MAG: hypothetical protein LC708_00250, partial [Actinobacteria bacterium]|nr:hypothetical protein [Actinomycetota bacterium]